MAENQASDGQEKTEQPTAKKRRDAKEKGQVPRSRELNTTVVLVAASVLLFMMADTIGKNIMAIFQKGLSVERKLVFETPMKVIEVFTTTLYDIFSLFVPYLLLLLLVVLLTPALIGGWSFSGKAFMPKFSRMNPLKGLKRIFSSKGLMELVKALLKVLVIAVVAVVFIRAYTADLLSLGNMGYKAAIVEGMKMLGWLFLVLSVTTILIAAIDVPFQIFQYIKQLRMTRQEVKDEFKQTEGDPEVKGRIRRMQQEMANQRMMEEIPDADVILTNPTHFSVALKYTDNDRGAPIVVAKGMDLIALRIREIAGDNNITIFEAPPLARALYFSTEINQEIPVELYYAVAQVLAYVYQLKTSGIVPEKPGDLDIPEGFRYE